MFGSDLLAKILDDFKGPVTLRQVVSVLVVFCIVSYTGYNIGVQIGENKQREAYLEREEKRSRELILEQEKSFNERIRLNNEILDLKEKLHICKMNQKNIGDAGGKE